MLTFTFIVNVNINCNILKQKFNCELEGEIKDLINRQIFLKYKFSTVEEKNSIINSKLYMYIFIP